jgi:uncharacterized cupredoxin-like copper-binding protein
MHTLRVPTLVAAFAIGATACSTSQAAQESDSTTVATAAAPNVVVVKTKDYAFDAPDTVRAGLTTLRLVTNPGQEMHQVGLIRLDSAKTPADLFRAMKSPGPMPAWAVEVAGVNPPVPGQTADATLNLAAGNYLLVCFVPSPDGVPHIAKGMSRPLVVTGTAAASAPLPGDVEIKLTDYAFGLSKPLTAGQHVIRVVNDGHQSHEVMVIRLAPGKTAAQVAAWVEKMDGPPPGEPMSGVAGLGVGQSASFPLTLTPGEYGLICFIPDAKDGKPHYVHGMVHQFKVS